MHRLVAIGVRNPASPATFDVSVFVTDRLEHRAIELRLAVHVRVPETCLDDANRELNAAIALAMKGLTWDCFRGRHRNEVFSDDE